MLKAPKGIWGLIVDKLDWQIFPVAAAGGVSAGSEPSKERPMNVAGQKKPSIAIDIHAHMMHLDVYAVTVNHSAFGKSNVRSDAEPGGQARRRRSAAISSAPR